MAVTPDGQRIVSGGGDHTVRVWSPANGHLERTLDSHTLSPQGAEYPLADGVRARAPERGSGDPDASRGEDRVEARAVRALAVTPDGQRIVSGSSDQIVRVWNLASGRLERTLEGHTRAVRATLAFWDGRLWDTRVRDQVGPVRRGAGPS